MSNISPAGRKHAEMFEKLGESIEFAGMAVSHLAMDPQRMSKSGKILMAADLAREYGFQDLDGSTRNIRSISVLCKVYEYNWTSHFIPSVCVFPYVFLMHLCCN